MTLENDFESYMRRVLNRGHATRPHADAPPSDTWQRVLARVQPPEETNEMDTAVLTTPATPGVPTYGVPPRSMGHYLNLAATIALVVAVAVAGWYTLGPLNDPDADPQLAALGIDQDEAGNGTCDVDPLTVDDAILMMKNPMEYLAPDMEGTPDLPFAEDEREGNYLYLTDSNVYERLATFIDIGTTPVVQSEFDAMLPVAQEYLDCLVHGTNGQTYRLLDPVTVQSQLVMRLPVLLTEDEIRERLEVYFAEPALSPDSTFQGELVPLPNENPELTAYVTYGHVLHNNGAYVVPLKWVNGDGEVIAEADVLGNPVSGDMDLVDLSLNLVIAKSSLDGNWYVTGFYSPDYYKPEVA